MEKNRGLMFHAAGLLLLLVPQYLLGMLTNLFVQFPQSKQEKTLWEFAWTQIPLAMHIILGILLLIGAIVLIIRSVQLKEKVWIICSIIGGLSMLIAALSGSFFIPTQMAVYSFIMSLTFVLAFLSYGFGIYLSKK